MQFKLDHVAVAVHDLEKAVEGFEKGLGLQCEHIETVPTQKARVAFFDVGSAHIELVAPTEEGAVTRSLEKRGEGLHHICLEVDDLEACLAFAKAAGLRLINDEPVPGAGGSRVAFIHPKSLSGVLVELVEKADREDR